jgi:glycosyltransferase involved in cell wall biosynthesis
VKVLIIQPFIKQGGAELVSVYLAHHLERLGHQVKIAVIFTDFSGMAPITRKLNYTLPPKPIQFLAKKSRFFLYFFGPFFLFWQVLKEREVDVLNPHNLPAYLIAPLVGKMRNIPVVWNCNEPPQKLSLKQGAKTGLSDWLMWAIANGPWETFLVKRIDKILVLSKMTQNQVKDRYKKKAKVARLGIDFKFFSQDNREEIEKLKDKYSLKDKFVILVVGKLHPLKNPIFALSVFKSVAKKIPKAALVFVGTGPLERELKKKVKRLGFSQRVLFPGFVSSNQLRSWYHLCDLNLVPVPNLSWGLTPFEALCQGKIAIVSETCGAAEVLSERKIGIVCSLTAKDFAREILNIYRNPSRFKRMGERGYNFVKNEVSWEDFTKRTLEVFKKEGV